MEWRQGVWREELEFISLELHVMGRVLVGGVGGKLLSGPELWRPDWVCALERGIWQGLRGWRWRELRSRRALCPGRCTAVCVAEGSLP